MDSRFPDFNNPPEPKTGYKIQTSAITVENPYQVQGSSAHKMGVESQSVFNRLLSICFSFAGRASIAQFWLVHLASILLLGMGIGLFVGLPDFLNHIADSEKFSLLMIGSIIPFVAYIWMNWAVTIKRFHDRDKSGAMILVGLIPYIGGFWILVECGFMPGTAGSNRFGKQVQGILG